MTALNTTRLRYLFLTLAIIHVSSGCNVGVVFFCKNIICTRNKVGKFSISPYAEQLSRSNRKRHRGVVPISSSNLYNHWKNVFLIIHAFFFA